MPAKVSIMCVSCKDKESMGGSGQRSRLLYKNIVASIAIKGYAAIISLMLVPLTLNCLGALQEMVVNKRHGFLVNPKDTKELENAIRKIIQPEIGKQISDFIQKGLLFWRAFTARNICKSP